jgi:hypothetical protein
VTHLPWCLHLQQSPKAESPLMRACNHHQSLAPPMPSPTTIIVIVSLTSKLRRCLSMQPSLSLALGLRPPTHIRCIRVLISIPLISESLENILGHLHLQQSLKAESPVMRACNHHQSLAPPMPSPTTVMVIVSLTSKLRRCLNMQPSLSLALGLRPPSHIR